MGDALRASQVAPFAQVARLRVVVQGEQIAPVLSPSADRVLFSRHGFAGLFVATLAGEPQVRQLSAAPRAGYRPLWRADGGAVGLRPRNAPFGGGALIAIDLQGVASEPFDPTPGYAVIQKDDCIYLTTPSHTLQVACGGDKYFAPQLTADRRHLVFCGLRRGVLAYRLADRRTIALGPGHQPALDGTGRRVVFVRAVDDGERLTAADLWIADLRHPAYRVAPLTRTADRLEQHPSLSRDGRTIAFSVGGAIFVGRLDIPKRPAR